MRQFQMPEPVVPPGPPVAPPPLEDPDGVPPAPVELPPPSDDPDPMTPPAPMRLGRLSRLGATVATGVSGRRLA